MRTEASSRPSPSPSSFLPVSSVPVFEVAALAQGAFPQEAESVAVAAARLPEEFEAEERVGSARDGCLVPLPVDAHSELAAPPDDFVPDESPAGSVPDGY